MLHLLIQNNCFLAFLAPGLGFTGPIRYHPPRGTWDGMGVDRQVDYGVFGLEATVPLGPCTPFIHSLHKRRAAGAATRRTGTGTGTQSLRCASRPLQLVQTATAT